MSITISNPSPFPAWLVLVALACLIAWIWVIVTIARTRTEDPLDRVVWLLIVLALNVVGMLLYLMFTPKPAVSSASSGVDDHEREIKRRANEGTL